MKLSEQMPEVDVEAAHKTLFGSPSPVNPAEEILDEALAERYGARSLRYLNLADQLTDSFKIAGAENKLAHNVTPDTEVITTGSVGSHGAAIVLLATMRGLKSHVFVPSYAPESKVEKMRQLGGNLVTVERMGDTVDESIAAAATLGEQPSSLFVHPFDDHRVAAGQGAFTYGRTPGVILFPIGGGGLATGTIHALHDASPDTHFVGVELYGADKFQRFVKDGSGLRSVNGFAEGIAVLDAGQVLKDTYRTMDRTRLTLVKVSEEATREATTYLWQNGLHFEHTSAVVIAALRHPHVRALTAGKDVEALLTGKGLPAERFEKEIRVFGTTIYDGIGRQAVSSCFTTS